MQAPAVPPAAAAPAVSSALQLQGAQIVTPGQALAATQLPEIRATPAQAQPQLFRPTPLHLLQVASAVSTADLLHLQAQQQLAQIAAARVANASAVLMQAAPTSPPQTVPLAVAQAALQQETVWRELGANLAQWRLSGRQGCYWAFYTAANYEGSTPGTRKLLTHDVSKSKSRVTMVKCMVCPGAEGVYDVNKYGGAPRRHVMSKHTALYKAFCHSIGEDSGLNGGDAAQAPAQAAAAPADISLGGGRRAGATAGKAPLKSVRKRAAAGSSGGGSEVNLFGSGKATEQRAAQCALVRTIASRAATWLKQGWVEPTLALFDIVGKHNAAGPVQIQNAYCTEDEPGSTFVLDNDGSSLPMMTKFCQERQPNLLALAKRIVEVDFAHKMNQKATAEYFGLSICKGGTKANDSANGSGDGDYSLQDRLFSLSLLDELISRQEAWHAKRRCQHYWPFFDLIEEKFIERKEHEASTVCINIRCVLCASSTSKKGGLYSILRGGGVGGPQKHVKNKHADVLGAFAGVMLAAEGAAGELVGWSTASEAPAKGSRRGKRLCVSNGNAAE